MMVMVIRARVFYHDGQAGTRPPVVSEGPRDDRATNRREWKNPDALAKGGDGG